MSPTVEPVPVPAARRRTGAELIVLALVAGTAAVIASNNWVFVAIPAVVAAFLIDVAFASLSARFWPRLLVALVTGAAAGLAMGVSPAWAFREAFGIEPPPGVHDARVWRHYVGGPGEHILIIEFNASDATVDALESRQDRSTYPDRLQRWRAGGGGWEAVWECFASGGIDGFAHLSWKRIAPFVNPQVVDLGRDYRGSARVALIREPGTGRCVVLHVRN